jgi:hypothetical protein
VGFAAAFGFDRTEVPAWLGASGLPFSTCVERALSCEGPLAFSLELATGAAAAGAGFDSGALSALGPDSPAAGTDG